MSESSNIRPTDYTVSTLRANTADTAGVALSIACGIHCLLTPILLLSLPNLGEAFHTPIVHRVIAGWLADQSAVG